MSASTDIYRTPLRRSRRIKIAAFTVALVAVGGAAFAFWTSTGAGTGTATTGSTTALTVNQTGSAVTGLGPGVAAKPLSGTFDNPNAATIRVTSVTATVSSVTSGGAPVSGCNASDYTISGTSTIGGGGDVPNGTGVGTWSGLSIAFNNKASTNQDACKGATVNIAYSAS